MTLRTLMVYGLDFFIIKPGAVLLILGAALLATLTFGPVRIGRVSLSLNSMLFGMTSATFGLTMVLWGAVTRNLYDYTNTARQRLERILPFGPIDIADAHTNTAESFSAMLKRALMGVWHWFSIKHADRYLHELCFRWNRRTTDIETRLAHIFSGTARRLRWLVA